MTRILLAEDNDIVAETLMLVLEAKGYETRRVANGVEALSTFDAVRPDVLITDLMMPGTDGIELIRQLRRLYPRLPIVAISGGGRAGNLNLLDMVRNLGADATLAKPIRPDDLTAAIRRAQERHVEP